MKTDKRKSGPWTFVSSTRTHSLLLLEKDMGQSEQPPHSFKKHFVCFNVAISLQSLILLSVPFVHQAAS